MDDVNSEYVDINSKERNKIKFLNVKYNGYGILIPVESLENKELCEELQKYEILEHFTFMNPRLPKLLSKILKITGLSVERFAEIYGMFKRSYYRLISNERGCNLKKIIEFINHSTIKNALTKKEFKYLKNELESIIIDGATKIWNRRTLLNFNPANLEKITIKNKDNYIFPTSFYEVKVIRERIRKILNEYAVNHNGEAPAITVLGELLKKEQLSINGFLGNEKRYENAYSDFITSETLAYLREAYWKKWKNVNEELDIVIKKLGRYPTRTDFERLGKQDLMAAIKRYHGGLTKVREKKGYKPVQKTLGYWKDWKNLENELIPILEKYGWKYLTDSDLEDLDLSDLIGGINRYHGGIPAVMEKLGIETPDTPKKRSYYSIRGYKTQKEVIDILKEYAKLRGIMVSQKKATKVGPHRYLELVCGKDKIIGIDIINSKLKSTIEGKWRIKEYHKYVDIFWVIVVSDKWDERQYQKWNKESPKNTIVIDGRYLEDFLNSLGSLEKPFKIPAYKIKLIDAYARCRYFNKEEIKKELK